MSQSNIIAPEGWQHLPGDPAEDYLGPFFLRRGQRAETTDDGAGEWITETLLPLRPAHINAYGTVHGGVLMTLADFTLCACARIDDTDEVITVSANLDFVSGAVEGEPVIGRGFVVRRTRTLVFTRAELAQGGELVLAASAVIKRRPTEK